ncbi:putative ADP-sugar pyrophosphatase [Triangularia verruculosa]|uniref:ADP-sugar pyrophosphatase n=1 Tax=Triangularia verruculosa TaxID=2587418 RepID=A0AAN6XJT5_9PEZI|nr:putative ADP-sugar pyrophosphatase [Triangularia verruculosa]
MDRTIAAMAPLEHTALPELPKSASPYIIDKKPIACGKHQGLGLLSYIDPRDKDKVVRERDFVFLRNYTDLNRPVGMLVPNIYKDSQGRWCTILVQQFRPQYEADTIEFPAGFVSRRRSETAEQAAVRELEEETTKTGSVIGPTSPPLTSEPVPIAAKLNAVFVRAKDKGGDEEGKQRLDKGEFTVELEVPLQELERKLNELADLHNVVVDPRVWMFAMGIRYALELKP